MEERTSRRKILQAAAALPAAGLGLMSAAVASAAETKNAADTCSSAADGAKSAGSGGSNKAPAAIFHEEDLSEAWSCLPFIIKGGTPEDVESDERGFAIKLPSGDVVAYARVCKKRGCKFEYSKTPEEHLGKLHESVEKGKVGGIISCKCHGSVFDVTANGAVIGGPDRESLVRYRVKRCHDKTCILV
jgi:Rieske Fe-S protein